MPENTTRRFFMGAAAAVSAMRVSGANERVNVAIVGLGGRGSNHLSIYSRLAEARVVGLCDVNQAAREKAQATLLKNTSEKAKEFEDMREAFADPNVEAVSIATPNHWHALAAIWAMKAGKDVYGEKPACYNIYEGQKLVQVARETKKMLQIGSQHRSNPFKMKAMAAVQGGLIGKVYQAKGLCYKRRASIGKKPDMPTPPGINWDMFLGPAPLRPFNELRFRYNWHWFWDTGNGDIGNQGVHELGIARWGMSEPEWPKGVYAHGGKFAYDDDQETPNTLTANFDFGGRELVFEVRGLLTGAEGAVPSGRRQDLPHRENVIAKAARHLDLIVEMNQVMNLTRILNPREAAIKHVLDSVLPWRLFAGASHVADAGTGAGFPGLPLSLVLPETEFSLLDATQKKARFVESAVAELGLPNVRVFPNRVEEWIHRNPAEIVTGRAIAPLHKTLLVFAPALKMGARVLLYKGPDADAEITEAIPEARKRQIYMKVVSRYELPDSLGARTVVELSR